MIDALVLGRGLPALVAALDLAEVGLRVTIAEGGNAETAATSPTTGLPLHPVRDEAGTLAEVIDRVLAPITTHEDRASAPDGASGDATTAEDPLADSADGADAAYSATTAEGGVRRIEPGMTLLRDRAGRWLPLPEPHVLGIPAVPIATDSVRLIGSGAGFRAYLDRVTPLLTVGQTKELGKLVKRRLGQTVLDRLVQPIVIERFGRDAEAVEVAVAAPGLNETFSRVGALSAAALAYADRNVARETRIEPAVGWSEFESRLRHRLSLYGVQMLGHTVSAVERTDAGYRVQLDDGVQLDARALVIDLGRRASMPQAYQPLIEGLRQPLGELGARLHAEIDIDRPEWLGEGQQAVALVGEFAARIEWQRDGTALLTLSGQSTGLDSLLAGADPGSMPGDSSAGEAGIISTVASATIAQATKAADELGVTTLGGADWRVSVDAAPVTTIVQRDANATAIESAVRAEPLVLPIGESLYGGDTSAATAAAEVGATALRRRLLGLSD